MNRYALFMVSFCVLSLPCLAAAEDHPIWNPGLEQAAVNTYNIGTTPTDIPALRSLIGDYLSADDASLRSRISATEFGGSSDNDTSAAHAKAVYNLALLYHLDGDVEAGRRAAVLLDRYADVFDGWSYEVCNGQCASWGIWFHADYALARWLALAYDLLAPAGVLESHAVGTQSKVRGLLLRIVQRDLEYRMYVFNWAFYRPLGTIIFGRVLDDPQLVHLGYWFYAAHMHEYYTQDGFIGEGSYSYHTDCTTRIVDANYPFYLDGYSDPDDYVHTPVDTRWDEGRIDNFDYETTYGDAVRRMRWSREQTLLPDGTFPVLNDTKHYGSSRGESAAETLLLHGLGHAILAGGSGEAQTQARLDFSHAVGHFHRDALHLIYYGDETETVGGTAYRETDRDWNTSTFGQNLVAIDETEQRAGYWVDWTNPLFVPDGADGARADRRTRPTLEGTNSHNNVLLFERGYGDFDAVHLVEVDALDAYSQVADRYRRLLVRVEIEPGEYYLADLFRARGGTQYDWLMHGGHDENTLTHSLGTSARSGSLGRITFDESITSDASFSASLDHGSAAGNLWMAGAPNSEVIFGTSPRHEFAGTQPHIVVRRTAAADEEVNFLAVHETVSGIASVSGVEALSFVGDAGSAVGMRVTLADGSEDLILYTLDEGPDYPIREVEGERITLRGRFAHIRRRDGEVVWMDLVEGAELRVGGETLSSTRDDFSYRGEITSVLRRESGAAQNAFVVSPSLPADGSVDGKTLLMTMGNGWTYAYRIDHVEGDRVVTLDEPGFEIDAGGIDRLYFPLPEHMGLERFPGPAAYLVSGSAVRAEDGTVTSTDAVPLPPGDAGPTFDVGPRSDVGPGFDGGANFDGGPGFDGGLPGDDITGDCTCRASGARETSAPLFGLLIFGALFLRRRARR